MRYTLFSSFLFSMFVLGACGAADPEDTTDEAVQMVTASGRAVEGAACLVTPVYRKDKCAPNLTCATVGGAGGGRCVRPASEAASCDPAYGNAGCVAGLVCTALGSGGGFCKGAGTGPCRGVNGGADCAPGRVCVPSTTTSAEGVCTWGGGEGTPCSDELVENECNEGLECVVSPGGGTGLCTRVRTPRGVPIPITATCRYLSVTASSPTPYFVGHTTYVPFNPDVCTETTTTMSGDRFGNGAPLPRQGTVVLSDLSDGSVRAVLAFFGSTSPQPAPVQQTVAPVLAALLNAQGADLSLSSDGTRESRRDLGPANFQSFSGWDIQSATTWFETQSSGSWDAGKMSLRHSATKYNRASSASPCPFDGIRWECEVTLDVH